MYLELLLLSMSLFAQYISVYHNHNHGILLSVFLITVAAAESALGLALAVVSNKFKLNLFI
jgi:NADH:ubiquinone oxidoreductase subunit K